MSNLWIEGSYSLAQRYGCNWRIFGRAHVRKLKGDFFVDIFFEVVTIVGVEDGGVEG